MSAGAGSDSKSVRETTNKCAVKLRIKGGG